MDFLDKIKDKIPAITLFTLVAASVYHVGFLSSAARVDIISSLSYQDIILASLYLFPLILTFYHLRIIINRLLSGEKINQNQTITIIVSIIACLAVSVISGKINPNTFTLIFAILSLSRLFKILIMKIDDKIEIKSIEAALVIVMIFTVSLSAGAASYKIQKNCSEPTYITTSQCENCILIKIYSKIIIMRKNEGNEVIIESNDNKYRILKTKRDNFSPINYTYCGFSHM
ncbi:hypothetical protein [Pannonibacter phragmitetus]|uniref:hypothetical protein n=1 Tax=Pannonibacter phragmitetus TaxID=121719 RepID=UPI003D2EEBB6